MKTQPLLLTGQLASLPHYCLQDCAQYECTSPTTATSLPPTSASATASATPTFVVATTGTVHHCSHPGKRGRRVSLHPRRRATLGCLPDHDEIARVCHIQLHRQLQIRHFSRRQHAQARHMPLATRTPASQHALVTALLRGSGSREARTAFPTAAARLGGAATTVASW